MLDQLTSNKELTLSFKENSKEWASRFKWEDTVEVFNKEIRSQLKIKETKSKVESEKFAEVTA